MDDSTAGEDGGASVSMDRRACGITPHNLEQKKQKKCAVLMHRQISPNTLERGKIFYAEFSSASPKILHHPYMAQLSNRGTFSGSFAR